MGIPYIVQKGAVMAHHGQRALTSHYNVSGTRPLPLYNTTLYKQHHTTYTIDKQWEEPILKLPEQLQCPALHHWLDTFRCFFLKV